MKRIVNGLWLFNTNVSKDLESSEKAIINNSKGKFLFVPSRFSERCMHETAIIRHKMQSNN